jgi:hypothetical protein
MKQICLIGILLLASPLTAQNSDRKITITVEKEGPGGMFSQPSVDLSDSEIAKLRSGIDDGVLKSKHKLVAEDYDQDHLFLSVVAEKLKMPDGKFYYVVSSELGVGKKSQWIGTLTHDVIVEPTIELTSRAIVYYLSSAELQGMLGNIK